MLKRAHIPARRTYEGAEIQDNLELKFLTCRSFLQGFTQKYNKVMTMSMLLLLCGIYAYLCICPVGFELHTGISIDK